MIEPDINEQMSNFAPSQNAEDLLRSAVPQEALSMTEAIMPRASMPLPAAPKQPTLDPALQAAVDEMASQRSAVMNASLYNASKKNPDTVGEAQRLAQQMGVGADIAERNLEEMRRGAAMVRALDRNLATSAPRTANALTEPDFANIAFDDLENLTGAEKLMRWFAGTDFFKGAQGTFIQTEMSIIDQLNSEGMATPQDFERYKELQRDLQIVGSPAEGSWTGSFANILASVGAGVPDAAEYAVIGANVGGVAGAIGGPFAPATVPAGLMLGASAGFATGMAKWMYQAMAGESYRQLREAEVPHDVAVPVSRGVGVITSALEFAGLGAEVWIASGVGKKLFAKEVATEVNAKLLQELTRRATLRGAVYEGGKLYVGEMLAESTVEATQSLITRVGTELARSYSRPDLQNMMQTPEGRRAIIGEAVDAFKTTAKGMALMGVPLPAVNFYIDRSRAVDAQRSQKFYEDLSKNAVDSKVRQRNPDAAERHFAAVMDGTGAETTYVNAHVMQNILNQAGVTADQVDSVLPGLSRQLADALAQGGDVTMPTATWAAKLAGTKLGDAMKPHMRPNAQAWSADTAAKYQAEVEKRKAEALAIEAEKETTDSTFVDEARAIEKEALTQLEAAGQDKKLAKLNARVYRDMVVVMAANPNRNQTPAQVHAEIGPDIFGPQGMQVAPGATAAPAPVSAVPAVENLPRPPKPEGMEQEFYDALIARAIKNVGNAGTVDLTFGVRPEGSETDMPLRVEANLRAAGNNEAADVYIEMARRVADRNIAAFQERRAAEAAAPLGQPAPVLEQAAASPRLMAVHNLSADNLAFAERMGGLAVPSIGVVTEQAGGVEGFGEITLIGSREMADPSTSRVFEADAYSARFPQPEWPKVPVAKADKFVQRLREVSKKYDDSSIVDVTFDGMVNNPDANKISNYWMRSSAAMALFLRDKGIEIEPKMRVPSTLSGLDWNEIDALRPVYNAVNQNQSYDDMEASPEYADLQEAYANAIRAKYAPIADDMPAGRVEKYATEFGPGTMSRLQRDMQQTDRNKVSYSETRDALETAIQPYQAEFKTWVDSTIREQFGAPFIRDGKLKKPYTLGNIVDAMTSAKVKGEEKGMTFGAGAARAAASEEFVDLEQMREAASTAIVDPEKYAEESKKSAVLLEAYRNAMADYSTLSNWRGQIDTWAALDGSMRAIARYGNRKRKSEKAMRDALRREGFDVSKMPPELIDQAIEAASALYTAPVPYFEAKPQRAVGLGEFKGAVIPSNASAETRSILERNNIPFVEYGSEQTRTADVRKFVDLLERGGKGVFFQSGVTPSFYSALEREVTAIDAKALTAAGWGERLKGLVNKGAIKAEELEWSGLLDYLKMQEGKVSKDTVLEFLRGNGVRVEQTNFMRRQINADPADIRTLKQAGLTISQDPYNRLEPTFFREQSESFEDVADIQYLANQGKVSQDVADAAYRVALLVKASELPKYEDWKLPGGTNYREVLLTLPVQPSLELPGRVEALPNGKFRVAYPRLQDAMFATREEADADLAKKQSRANRGAFISTHWDQPNVLVHLRMNDRVDADGKRVLFVEEVQSDWGQAGVKRGFVNQRAADEAELADLSRQQEENPTDARKKQIARIQERLTKDEYNIARAPYVETTDGWLNLGLKQIMLEAVRGGYDRVAFVSGQQSADRYDLSKQVESIVFNKNMDGTFSYQVTSRDVESDELDGDNKTLEQIEGTFGKEIAQKMDAATPADTVDATEQEDMFPNELSGLDLKVGGEGMQNFYDKIVPAAMGKLLKKYGGGKLVQVAMSTERRVTNDEIMAAERRGDFAEAERLTAIMERQELGRGEATAGESIIGDQPGFDITPELVKKLESGLPLFQAVPERGPPLGQYDANRIAILLNTKASATTFFHELIHWRMDMAIRMVNQGKASAQEAADVDTLFRSFGIAGDTPQERLATWNKMSIEQQRPHWEAVAYNSEIYLFEGKAPSVEMQGVFDRLHAFVKRVYVSIKTELNDLYRQEFGKDLPILTGEVREVMDRWLASEEQIQRKQAMMQMVPLFLTQEESGMDDATWAQHQQASKEAEEAAVTDLTKASLRQMEWLSGARSRILKKLQSMHDDLRKKTRAEVMEEVKNEPVYAAMSILKTGEGRAKNGELVKFNDKFKLNLEMVKKMLPEEQVRQLGYGKYGMVAADGISPDMVAEMVGFSSGDELVLAILAAKPLKEEVDARTDRRMMEEHGELNTPQAMEEAVQRALHNEARARFNAVYVRFLSKSTAPVQAFMDAAKLAARQIISGKVIRDLRPGDHQAAEAKAARDAAEAHKSRRTAEQAAKAAETKERNVGLSAAAAGVPMTEVEAAAAAKGQEAAQRVAEREAEYKAKYGDRTPEQVMLRAKQIQLLQNQLAREAQEAKDEVAKAVKDFRKFFKADDKLAKTRNMDLVDAARAILSAFGFGKSDKSPAEYIDKLKAYNPEMYAAIEPLVMAATSGSKNYKDLTVEQFRQLREVVDALWEQSRRDKLVEIDGKMVALSDVVGELETRLDEIGVPKVVAGERGAPTTKDRAVRGFYDVKAAMRRVEHWADATDGAKGIGPFTKYIWRPIKDAVNAYRIDRNKYVKKYVELLKQVVLPEGKIESKELDYTFGNANGGIGKAELLGALMHTGNDSNKKKLLVGRGWGSINEDGTLDSSRWDAFVARMIKQGVLTKSDFDFVQATWDLLEEVKPIAQKAHRSIFGFYFKEVEATPFTNEFGTFRGGYVPAKTDAFIVRDAQRQSKMEELESDFRNSMPSTGMGFTMGRVEYNKPLSMDVRLVTKHIDDVLRFAHVQPAIKDVLRILKNRGFSDKLSRIDPTVVEEMLIPWLNRAARQVTSEPGRNKGMDKFWKTVRSRTGLSIMAANLRNALQQPTGLFPAMLKVSKTQLGNALLTYMGSPFKTAEEVASLSTFMNERLQSQIFNMQDDINEILLNPNAYKKVQKWTERHGYFLQSAFQNMVDVVVWTAKYNQVLAESKVGASDTKVQREAIQQADAAVRLTQGSMSAEDISAYEVGTPFYKTFNQFGGYFNMLANLNADEYIKVIRDLGWRGNKGKLLNIYILGFMAPTLVADAIARSMGGGWDDDDDGYFDDFMDWFFGSQARAAAAMIPFGSTAATAITTAFNSKAYDDRISASPSIVALEASTIGVGKTIINIADDDKDVTGKNVRDVMTLISLATGTPVTVLGRPVGYLVDVNRKKIKPTGPIDVARGLVTGVAGGESKKK